jgi:WD40 repeat protein
MEHQRGVSAVAYSPNGRYLLAGSFDGVLYIWKVKENVCVSKILYVYGSIITGVAFSPNSRSIACTGFDGSLLVQPFIEDAWLCGFAAALLSLGFVPYAALDVIDCVLCVASGKSFADISREHFERIKIVESVQAKLRESIPNS